MRPWGEVSFTRADNGELVVHIGERTHIAPVPMAALEVFSHTFRRMVVPTGDLRAGHPGWITLALDCRSCDGPAVDEALGVEEPAVDEWEAGTRHPTIDELRRLATLTSMPLGWFLNPDAPPTLTNVFICGTGA